MIKPISVNDTPSHNILQASRYDAVPDELKNLKQWARYTKIDGRDKRPAYLNERPMKWGTQSNWLSFAQVAPFEKIGCFPTPEAGILFIDADGCRNKETGEIHPMVTDWLQRAQTYGEISVSEYGIKFYIKGTIPDNKPLICKDVPWNYDPSGHNGLEIYAQKHFIAVTGNILPDCPSEINEAPDVLTDILTRFSKPTKQKKKKSEPFKEKKTAGEITNFDPTNSTFDTWVHQHLKVREVLDDGYIVECPWGHLHTTQGDVARIWYGPPHTFNCFHAHCDGRTWPEVRTMYEPDAYEWKKLRSVEQSTVYPFAYPQISMQEQEEQLSSASLAIKQAIRDHVTTNDGTALIISYPPGTGKSHAAAELVVDDGIATAWMAPTKEVANSVPALKKIYHIQPVNKHNCPTPELSHATSEKGYNATRSIHKHHICNWMQQPFEEGSAVFQQQYYKSLYPASHDLVINDEANLSDWLEERKITIPALRKLNAYKTPDSEEDHFLRAVQATITDLCPTKGVVSGKAIFDRLDRDGQLMNWLGIFIKKYANTLPATGVDLSNDTFDELTHLYNKPDVILPHLIKALAEELVKWQSGKQWNSRISIRQDTSGEPALFITEPRQLLTKKNEAFPPFVHLDATADETIHNKLFEKEIKVLRADINPAPGSEHWAIRNKRYGKKSHTAKHKDGSANKTLERTIKEAKHMLKKIDPDKKIGLISHMGCVDEIAEALGIPEDQTGYYWNIRGSNSLEKCDVLLLIGTPALNPQTIAQMGRSLYCDDPEVIIEDWSQEIGYTDPRLQHLSQFLTNSELTQAAHRVRPIRHPNKTIISFCEGEIDFLPITRKYTNIPDMTEDGDNLHDVHKEASYEKVRIAYEKLSENGNRPTTEEVRKLARVGRDTVVEWMQENAPTQFENDASTRSANVVDYIDPRVPGSFSNSEGQQTMDSPVPKGEQSTMINPDDIQHYHGIDKDARVMTPLGQGTVVCIRVIGGEYGVRVTVSVDRLGWKSFKAEEVTPFIQATPLINSKVIAALDELFGVM